VLTGEELATDREFIEKHALEVRTSETRPLLWYRTQSLSIRTQSLSRRPLQRVHLLWLPKGDEVKPRREFIEKHALPVYWSVNRYLVVGRASCRRLLSHNGKILTDVPATVCELTDH